MNNNLLAGYMGSPSILTSAERQELILPGVVYHKFSFFNYGECTILVNGSDPIFLAAEQGFSSDSSDTPIKSFVVVEADIKFNWIGAFKYASVY